MGKPEMPFTEWMGVSIERSSNWVNKHEFDSLIFLYLRGDQKGFSRTGGETARERLLLQQVSSIREPAATVQNRTSSEVLFCFFRTVDER